MSAIASSERARRALDAAAVVSAVLFVVLLLVVRDDRPTALDSRALRDVLAHRTEGLGDAARLITRLGASSLLYPFALVALVVLRWRRAPWTAAVAPLVALATSGILVTVCKQSMARERPPLDTRWVMERAPSFPSGHTANSTAFYLTLALVIATLYVGSRWARVAVVAGFACIPVVVGLTRLVLAVHWATDVVAGWALGTFVASTVVRLLVLARAPTPGPAPAPV